MRKLLFIAFISGVLIACSPARRLARLQYTHPELFSDTALTLRIDTILPSEKTDTLIQWQWLRDTVVQTVTVNAGHARATLDKTPQGLRLTAEQIRDTITLTRAYTVPRVIIKNLPREETAAQAFFRRLGIAVTIAGGLLLALYVAIRALKG